MAGLKSLILKRGDYFHEPDIIGIKKIIFGIVVHMLAQSEMIPIMVLLLWAWWHSNVTFLLN